MTNTKAQRRGWRPETIAIVRGGGQSSVEGWVHADAPGLAVVRRVNRSGLVVTHLASGLAVCPGRNRAFRSRAFARETALRLAAITDWTRNAAAMRALPQDVLDRIEAVVTIACQLGALVRS